MTVPSMARTDRPQSIGFYIKRFVRNTTNQIWTLIPAIVRNVHNDKCTVDVELKMAASGSEGGLIPNVPIVYPRSLHGGIFVPYSAGDVVLLGVSKLPLSQQLANKDVVPVVNLEKIKHFRLENCFVLGGFILDFEPNTEQWTGGPLLTIPTSGPSIFSDDTITLHSQKFIKLLGDSIWQWHLIGTNGLWSSTATREAISGMTPKIGWKQVSGDVIYGQWQMPGNMELTSGLCPVLECVVAASASGTVQMRISLEARLEPGSSSVSKTVNLTQTVTSTPAVLYRWNKWAMLTDAAFKKWMTVDFKIERTGGTYLGDLWTTGLIWQYRANQHGYAKTYETDVP